MEFLKERVFTALNADEVKADGISRRLEYYRLKRKYERILQEICKIDKNILFFKIYSLKRR